MHFCGALAQDAAQESAHQQQQNDDGCKDGPLVRRCSTAFCWCTGEGAKCLLSEFGVQLVL